MSRPLALAYVAGATPPDWEVRIVDESAARIDFDCAVDLVGITAYTASATRAYQIASEFRRRGVAVVIGGIHATVPPMVRAGLWHASAAPSSTTSTLCDVVAIGASLEAERAQGQVSHTAGNVERFDLGASRVLE